MTEVLKIPSYVKPALARLKTGDVIVCQLSQSEEAVDGYLHFTASDSRKMGGGNLPLAQAAGANCSLWRRSSAGMPTNLSGDPL